MSANNRQVGGDHYKTGGEEHWDRVARLGLDYFQGQITKYVERWKKKGGVQDLHKARHFLDKYIELAEAEQKRRQTERVYDTDLNSAVFDRVRERATAERELENDNATGDKLETARTPNWP